MDNNRGPDINAYGAYETSSLRYHNRVTIELHGVSKQAYAEQTPSVPPEPAAQHGQPRALEPGSRRAPRLAADVPCAAAPMAAGAPPVSVEGGDTEVTVTVMGEAVLDAPRAPAR